MRRASQLAVACVLLMGCGGGATGSLPTPAAASSPGCKGDTWTWDGTKFRAAGVTGPPARDLAALAFDAARHVYVMFGGRARSESLDDTWTWNGSTWKQMSPSHRPPARRDSTMAFDPVRQVVVLYGGQVQDNAEGTTTGDTWTWDGRDWTQLDFGPGAPGVREGARMVTAGERVLLFGGRHYNIDYFGDAYAWDGKRWTLADTKPRPPGRIGPAVAWDPVHSALFIFGGAELNAAGGGAAGTPIADAWSLSGHRWTSVPASGPPPLGYPVAIWDAKAQRVVVLLGLNCPAPSADAWAWNGAAWTQLARPGIPARWGAALAPDTNGGALLFGGSDESGC
jgi:hypothetical protein